MTNPKGQKVNMLLQQTTEGYKTVFAPVEEGPHKINVNFAGKEVPRSPFHVNVEPAVNVGAVIVKGLETRKLSYRSFLLPLRYAFTRQHNRSNYHVLVSKCP